MHLRHQALIVLLGTGCLGSTGCARLIGAIIAPQQAGMAAAGQVANTATAPLQNDLSGIGAEVDRLVAAKSANLAELQRIQGEIERRATEAVQGGSAQANPERLRPWHPRAPPEDVQLGKRAVSDDMVVQPQQAERGLATVGPIPDGIGPGELPAPMQLYRVRVGGLR